MHEDRLVHFLYETAGRLRTDAENFCARAMTKLESYCMRRRILLAEVPKVFYKKSRRVMQKSASHSLPRK